MKCLRSLQEKREAAKDRIVRHSSSWGIGQEKERQEGIKRSHQGGQREGRSETGWGGVTSTLRDLAPMR